ncbi:MAG: hypothetical protein U0V56_05925 [Actinomycetota bacterium]
MSLADADQPMRSMRELGRAADADGACYLTGGATAVSSRWRRTTIDVDIHLEPQTDALLQAIHQLKELRVNVELASPGFVRSRSGRVAVRSWLARAG